MSEKEIWDFVSLVTQVMNFWHLSQPLQCVLITSVNAKKMQVPSQHNSKHHALGDPAGAGRDGSSVPTQTPPFCDKEGAFFIFFFHGFGLVWLFPQEKKNSGELSLGPSSEM